MIKVDIEQGTPEWLELKAGVPSASNFSKIVTGKGAKSTQREKYLYQLAGEKIAGIKGESFQSAAMLRGIELEPEAVRAYELIKSVDTEKVGVCYKDEAKAFLCSPDRLIKDDPEGMLEIKCPEIQTQVEYLLKGVLPSKYLQQVQGQMYVTGAKWCDFMSYYPGLKPFIIRVKRDDMFIAALDRELKLFCVELDRIVEKIK